MATLDIKYLVDKNDTKFFPATHVNGVVVDTGGTTIQSWLNAQLETKASQSDVNAISGDVATKASTAITITAGTGLSGGGDLSANRTISLSMPSTYTGTSMPTVVNNHEPIVYVLVSTSSASLANQTCPITLDEGQQCNVIYKTSAACTIPFATSGVITADGQQLSITTAAGGYAEVNYIKLGGNVFLRGV